MGERLESVLEISTAGELGVMASDLEQSIACFFSLPVHSFSLRLALQFDVVLLKVTVLQVPPLMIPARFHLVQNDSSFHLRASPSVAVLRDAQQKSEFVRRLRPLGIEVLYSLHHLRTQSADGERVHASVVFAAILGSWCFEVGRIFQKSTK